MMDQSKPCEAKYGEICCAGCKGHSGDHNGASETAKVVWVDWVLEYAKSPVANSDELAEVIARNVQPSPDADSEPAPGSFKCPCCACPWRQCVHDDCSECGGKRLNAEARPVPPSPSWRVSQGLIREERGGLEMIYAPWKGFTVIGLGIAIDVLLQWHFGRGGGLAGVPTAASFFVAWGWAMARTKGGTQR